MERVLMPFRAFAVSNLRRLVSRIDTHWLVS